MITAKNTRFQVIPIYDKKEDWFLYRHGKQYGAYILTGQGRIPPFQIVDDTNSFSEIQLYKIDDISNPLGSTTAAGTKTTTEVDFDLYQTGTDQKIITWCPQGDIISMDQETWYFFTFTIGGVLKYSEPFYVGCFTLPSFKLEWTSDCNTNNAYYDDDELINELWFDDDLVLNTPAQEEEIEKNANGEIIKHLLYNRYSFTKICPQYMLDAFGSLNSHSQVRLYDYRDSGTEYVTMFDISVNKEDSEKEDYTTVTVSYRIAEEVYMDNAGCCAPVDFIDEELPSGGEGGTCPGFGITISEAAGELSYALASEPIDGTLSITWAKDGSTIGTGATVSLGGFGNYKVTAQKNGCTVTDTYIYLDPCESFNLEVSQVDGIISANATGHTDPVTFKVYDPVSAEVATSVPYTAVTSGVHTVEATSGDCVREKTITVNLESGCDHTAEIARSGAQLTGSSDDGTATFEWYLDTGNGYGSLLSTSAVLDISVNGLYKFIATVDGCAITATKVVTDLGLSVEVTNISDIATGSGEVQTVTGVTGVLVDFDYQPSRWIVDRNTNVLTYVSGTPTDVNEYTVTNGQYEFAAAFPLTVDDIITRRPV